MLMHLKNMQAGMGSSPCACLFVCGTTDAYDLRCLGFAPAETQSSGVLC